MPCENSNDTSILIQSLDSLRTHASQCGHLLATRYCYDAVKVFVCVKIAASLQCRSSGGNGQRVKSAFKDVHNLPVLGYSYGALSSLQIW